MNSGLKRALEQALGERVFGASSVTGGDINQAYRVELASGEALFVKSNPGAPPTMFTAEARGLEWLRSAGAVRVPEVRHVSGPDEAIQFLVLEFIAAGRPRADFDERLGRELAALHRVGAKGFGFDSDNFIGSLPQRNGAHANWAEFYRAERLEPQLARAVDGGHLSYALRRAAARVLERLPELVGPAEPPARLHGDLWSGNLHIDEQGAPCLLDPAVYGGHREMDLAMMRLFGGFAERVFAAYAEATPLAPGAAERTPLYQLYPLLVHVNLFGGSYAGSVERALACYG